MAWSGSSLRLRRDSPVDALTLDFRPPEPGDNRLLLWKLPSLWHVVAAALAN